MDMTDSYGLLFIGSFMATVLWGMTCVQTVFYFTNYGSDRWGFKALVFWLWLCDAAHEFFCIYGLWNTLIPAFGRLQTGSSPAEYNLENAFTWQLSVTGVIAAVAQGFFTWRIWRFVKKKIFLMTLIPLTAGQWILSFIFSVLPTAKVLASTSMSATDVHNETNLGPFILILGAIYATTDVLIAVTMCIILRRGRTGVISTDRVIVRLMTASVSTGACTAVFAVFTVVAAIASNRTILFFVGHLPLAPLYCNAVLANLNSRKYIVRSGAGNSGDRGNTIGTSFRFNSMYSSMFSSTQDTSEAESGSGPGEVAQEPIPLVDLPRNSKAVRFS